MRVLYNITELDVAGAERALYHLAVGMAERGHNVEVACLIGHGEIGSWLEARGIRVHYLDSKWHRPIALLGSFAQIVRSFEPDVLHSFLYHANAVGRVVGRLVAKGAVVCAVRGEHGERTARLRLDGWTQGWMDAATCVSEATRRYTSTLSGIPLDRLVAIPNAVDLERFDLERGPIRASLGVSSNQLLIAAIGRLVAGKGWELFLEALVLPLRRFPHAVCLVVGTGPRHTSLQLQAEALGLTDRIHFLGWRGDVPQVLVDADLVVHSSESEGMPNVILEAMAAGRAVIATAVGGCPELVEHEVTGLLVPPRDLLRMEQAIDRCLAEPGWTAALGAAGRRKAASEHSIEKLVDRNEQLYRQVLDGRI